MVKIVPHLWYVDNAREAVAFYTSLFHDAKINWRYTLQNTPSGDADLIEFEIGGQTMAAISGDRIFN